MPTESLDEMVNVSNCVICEGALRRIKRALVSPFLAARIWNRRPFCVDLVECKTCGFMFYNPRLDDEAAGRLYAGYRSEEYERMRHASEPWYTESFNAGLGSQAAYERRRPVLAAILRQYIGEGEIRSVLDYGGERGDLVRGLVDGAAAFVYDISRIPAVDGVTATNKPAMCKADLVINSNVLEHVGSPRVAIRGWQNLQKSRAARNRGFDAPRSGSSHASPSQPLLNARTHKLLFRAIVGDFDAVRRV